MIGPILEETFPVIWELENKPVLTILKVTMVNRPNSLNLSNVTANEPYQTIQEDIPCLYSGGPIKSQPETNTTNVDLVFFLRSSDLLHPIDHKNVYRFEGRLYKTIAGGINPIFGLLEISVLRGD